MLNIKIIRRLTTLFVLTCAPLFISSVNAVELGSFGSSIFQFQKKLAAKGNTQAQYKLGTLYEFGVSVNPDIDEARNWYNKAAKKKYTPAINRLIYLEIKQSGYDKAKHDSWFKGLLDQAGKRDANALILLGQMNRHGINVSKNLDQSLTYLDIASSLGNSEIESEIDEVMREIEARDALKEKIEASRSESKEETNEAKPKPKAKKKPKKKVAKKPKPTPKPSNKDDRRRKYEAAMRKLQEEARLMKQQQEWSEEQE